MGALHDLTSRLTDTLMGLAQVYSADILLYANDKMESLAAADTENTEAFMEVLLEVSKKYLELNKKVFKDYLAFVGAFSRAMSVVVNRNPFTV